MSLVLAALAALIQTAPVADATAPAVETAPAAPSPAGEAKPVAKFNLDTPIETIAADAAGKAALDAALPGLLTHSSYESFKGMSLRQVQPFSNGALTDALMASTEAALAAVE